MQKEKPFMSGRMFHFRNYSKSSDDVWSWVCIKAGSPDLCWFLLVNTGLQPISHEDKPASFYSFSKCISITYQYGNVSLRHHDLLNYRRNFSIQIFLTSVRFGTDSNLLCFH
jgi:hypothetical protein